MGGGGKGGGEQKIAEKYYMGVHIITCYGPVDEVSQIRIGERVAWSGSVTGNTTVNINQENLFGGEEREGGFSGPINFEFGTAGQGQNGYLANQVGSTNLPGYRGVQGFVFNQCYFAANNPYFKDVDFIVSRRPSLFDAGTKNIGNDMNPAHVIYECMTNIDWGMGISSSVIDVASFQSVASTLVSESMGISIVWTQQQPIEEFINSILDHINGLLYVDPATGNFKLKLIRGGYSVGSLPLFDESNVVDLESYERRGWGETINELTVVYHNHDIDQDIPVRVQNLANINIQGGAIISQTRNYLGFTNGTLALRAAQRDLLALSSPLSKIRLKVNRDAWNLAIGDVFRFAWPKLNISQIVYRVGNLDTGTLQDNHIVVEAVEDVFAVPTASYVSGQDTQWVAPVLTALPADDQVVQEAGYWDVVRVVGEDLADNVDDLEGYIHVGARRANGLQYDYDLEDRVSPASYEFARRGSWSPSAELVGSISQSITSSITYTDDFDMGLFKVGQYIQIDDEKMEVIAHNPSTKSMTVNRGVLDTTPENHSNGARIWGLQVYNGFDSSPFLHGETVDVRLISRAGNGKLTPGSAPVSSHTMNQRFARPYAPGNFTIDDVDNYVIVKMTHPSGVRVNWSHRDRLLQTQPSGFTTQSEGDIGPEGGTTYQVQYKDENDVLRRTENGISGKESVWTVGEEVADTGIGRLNNLMRVRLTSFRDGLESFKAQDLVFKRADYGYNYGNFYGGVSDIGNDRIISPLDLPDLGLWLDATQITGLSNGDPITTWEDNSGNNIDVGATGTNRPTYVASGLNSLPTVNFNDASSQGFSTTGVNFSQYIGANAGSAFIVVRIDSGSATNNQLINHSDGAYLYALAHVVGGSPSLVYGHGLSADLVSEAAVGFDNGTWKCIRFSRNGIGADQTMVDVAGSNFLSDAIPSSLSGGSSGTLYIGRTGGSFLKGQIAEIITYKRFLSTAECELIREYLTDKWGITC